MEILRNIRNKVSNFVSMHPRTSKMIFVTALIVASVGVMTLVSGNSDEAYGFRAFICSAGRGGHCWLE